jgi:2-oxoisovalerate dehydrogenase E1 component
VRKAREAGKKRDGKNAASPSVMIAWSVVRAMEKHAGFRRLMMEDDRIIENDDFDLGIAVALDGDRLATAVIREANKKSWPEFVKIYDELIEQTRTGRVDAMNAPWLLHNCFRYRAGRRVTWYRRRSEHFSGHAHHE